MPNDTIIMAAEIIKIKATVPILPYTWWRWTRVIEFSIRTKIFRQRRYLIDQWIMVYATDDIGV